MSGVIEGGWAFVWAAYALTAVVFAAYTISVLVRYRRVRRERPEGERHE